MVKAGSKLQLVDFYYASHELELLDTEIALASLKVWINPVDMRDLYEWPIEVTGYAFHKRLKEKESASYFEFGEWKFYPSMAVTEGIVIVLSDDGNVTSIKKEEDGEA